MKNLLNFKNKIKILAFDYGNTLIEFGIKQIDNISNELNEAIYDLYGPCDIEKLKEIRKQQILAPYSNNYIENDIRETTTELIYELYGKKPAKDQIEHLINTRYNSFVRNAKASDETLKLIEELSKSYRLALVSNFPCQKSIIDSLKTNGLHKFFDSIVVSGEIGFIKPHPEPFNKMLADLNADASQTIFIGDNWLADIQGAKKSGMKAIHTTQYVSYENFQPYENDFQPDLTISDLQELRKYL